MVRIGAKDLYRDDLPLGQAERPILIDTSPPIVLEIFEPANETLTTFALVDVVGRVKDNDKRGTLRSSRRCAGPFGCGSGGLDSL